MSNILKRSIILFLALGLASCQGINDGAAEKKQHPIIKVAHQQKTAQKQVAERAAKKVLEIDEIKKARAVTTDKTLLMAFDVYHLNRFRIKRIEKEVKADLKKMFPDKNIKVSHDRKIMLEVEKLQQKMEQNELDQKELNKNVKKITKLMKEKT